MAWRWRLFAGEAIGRPVTGDVATGRPGKMGAQHQHRLVGIAVDEGLAGYPRCLCIGAEIARQLGNADLHGVVHHVAGDDGVMPL